MKPFEELILTDEHDYKHTYVYETGALINNNIFLDKKNDEKKFDLVREAIFLRAIYKKKGFDPNTEEGIQKLQYLYMELDNPDSPLYKIAQGIASIRAEGLRASELESRYIDDVMYGSAKDFYCRPSDEEAAKYKETMESGYQAVREFQDKRKVYGKEGKPQHAPQMNIIGKFDMLAYDNHYAAVGSDKYVASKKGVHEDNFNKTLDQLRKDLKKRLSVMIADDQKRQEKDKAANRPDSRSESYKDYVAQAGNVLKILDDKKMKAKDLYEQLDVLKQKAEAYKNAHKGLTKGMIGNGRTRFKNAEKVASRLEKDLETLNTTFKGAYNASMKNASFSLEKYDQKRNSYKVLQKINKDYDLAIKKQVISQYNQQKMTLDDAFATVIALSEIGTTAKKCVDAAQKNYKSEKIEGYKKTSPFEPDMNLKARVAQIKETPAFKNMVKNSLTHSLIHDKIKRGKATDLYRRYNDQVMSLANNAAHDSKKRQGPQK